MWAAKFCCNKIHRVPANMTTVKCLHVCDNISQKYELPLYNFCRWEMSVGCTAKHYWTWVAYRQHTAMDLSTGRLPAYDRLLTDPLGSLLSADSPVHNTKIHHTLVITSDQQGTTSCLHISYILQISCFHTKNIPLPDGSVNNHNYLNTYYHYCH